MMSRLKITTILKMSRVKITTMFSNFMKQCNGVKETNHHVFQFHDISRIKPTNLILQPFPGATTCTWDGHWQVSIVCFVNMLLFIFIFWLYILIFILSFLFFLWTCWSLSFDLRIVTFIFLVNMLVFILIFVSLYLCVNMLVSIADCRGALESVIFAMYGSKHVKISFHN